MPTNVIVLYVPGCFGSHVANLLSLDQKFQQFFDIDSYDLAKPNAHHGRPSMVEVVCLQNHEADKFLDKNIVWSEHLSTLIHHQSIKKFVDQMPNKFFLVINLPRFGSDIYHRMHRTGFSVSELAHNELTHLYTPDICARLLHYPQERFWNLDPEIIWQQDAAPMIEHITRSAPIDLDLDLDLCCALHEKWYHSVTKTL